MRAALSRCCVCALKPDFVILEQLRWSRDSVDSESDASDLARCLFYEHTARVRLLSATPWEMYTLADDYHEDHHAELVRMARFVMGPEAASAFARDIPPYDRRRSGWRHVAGADRRAQGRARLLRIMVRTKVCVPGFPATRSTSYAHADRRPGSH